MSKVKLLDIQPTFKIECEKDALCCKYSPNREFFVAGHMDGIIRVYKTSDGSVVNELVREDLSEDLPVTSVQFKPSAQKSQSTALLSTYTDGRVRIWDYENNKVILDIKENRQVLGSVFHPKLNKFLTVGDNAAIYLYNEETGQCEQTYEKGSQSGVINGHTSRVFTAVFHPQQTSEFVSGGWDSVVHFWDLRTANSVRFIKGVHMCGEGLDISKSGRELLTCSYSRENSLQLWHYQQGRLLADIEPDLLKCQLYCGQWLTPDAVIVGGTDPNLLRVVSLKSLTTVMHYKGNSSGVYCVDHFTKSTKGKKEPSSADVSCLFSIDRLLIQSDFTLK